jgi:hypothetical protein
VGWIVLLNDMAYSEYKKKWYENNKDRLNKEREERMKTYPIKLCDCGCGQELKCFDKRGRPVRFITNHHRNGKHITEEHKNKIALKNSQRIRTKEEIERLRYLAKLRIGNPLTEEHKQKIGEGCKGKEAWNKGKTDIYSVEILEQKRILFSGENNPKWNGGHGINYYGPEFNISFKNKIRKRECYKCALCNDPQLDIKLHIHHIDWNYKNTTKENCIALCISCHNKVHGNKHKHEWINYFKRMLNERYGYQYDIYQESEIFQCK